MGIGRGSSSPLSMSHVDGLSAAVFVKSPSFDTVKHLQHVRAHAAAPSHVNGYVNTKAKGRTFDFEDGPPREPLAAPAPRVGQSPSERADAAVAAETQLQTHRPLAAVGAAVGDTAAAVRSLSGQSPARVLSSLLPANAERVDSDRPRAAADESKGSHPHGIGVSANVS